MKNYYFDNDYTFYFIEKTEKGYKVVEACIAEPPYIHTQMYYSDISKDNDFKKIEEREFHTGFDKALQQIKKYIFNY